MKKITIQKVSIHLKSVLNIFFIPSRDSNYATVTSYLSLSESDEIISSREGSAKWKALDNKVQKIILNQVSLSIDGLFSYQGEKIDESQLLKFPRDNSTKISSAIKYAVC